MQGTAIAKLEPNGFRAAIATRPTTGLQLNSLNDYKELASILVASGFCADTQDTAQACYKMLYGAELGLPPIASLNGIYIQESNKKVKENINGTWTEKWVKIKKPSILGGTMATLIKKSNRYNFTIKEHSNEASCIEVTEYGKPIGIFSFTIEDARQAELITGANADNYRKYPRNMLFNRNISNIAKQVCSDVFGGAPVYIPEEYDMVVDADTGAPLGAEASVDGLTSAGMFHQYANEELAMRGEPTVAEKKAAAKAAKAEEKLSAPAPTASTSTAPSPSEGGNATSAPTPAPSDTPAPSTTPASTATGTSSAGHVDSAKLKQFAGPEGEAELQKAATEGKVPMGEIAGYMKEKHGVTKQTRPTHFTWKCVYDTLYFIKKRAMELNKIDLTGIEEIPF